MLDHAIESKDAAAILSDYLSELMNQCVIDFNEVKLKRQIEYL